MLVHELVAKLIELEPGLEIYIDVGDDIAHGDIGIETVFEDAQIAGYILVKEEESDSPEQLELPYDKDVH